MTVNSSVSSVSYDGDGVSTGFAVPYYFLADTHLRVSVLNKGTGVVTTLTLNTDYTVSGAGVQPGGAITTTVPPASNTRITIDRNVPIDQQVDYTPNDKFPADVTERALDKLTMIAQEHDQTLSRALVLGVGDIDGSGSYRANGNRIQDLGDAVGMTDAVNRQTMLRAFADYATDGTGQAVVQLLADASSPTNGDAMVGVKQTDVGGVPRTQHDRNQEDRRVTDYGDNDVAFAALNALSRVISSYFLPPGSHVTGRDILRTIVGPGTIVNPDGSVNNMLAWRSSKIVTHDISGRVGDVAQLQASMAGKVTTVAVFGDSIWQGESDIAYSDSAAGLLEDFCRDSFPGIAWRFVNYSIPGRGIAEANSDTYVGTSGPETPGVNFNKIRGWQNIPPNQTLWPTGSVAGKTWFNHVRDESPDLVIIAFGMNDTSGDANAWAATLKSLVTNRMRTWTKVPSIAVVTPMLPTRDFEPWITYNPRIQANADAMRGVCQELNLTLIDANRLARAYREGIDVASPRTRYVQTAGDIGAWALLSGARPSYSSDVLTWAAAGDAVRKASEAHVDLSSTFSVSSLSTIYGFKYRVNPADFSDGYTLQVQPSVPQVVLYYKTTAVASSSIDPITVGAGVVLEVRCVGCRHRVFVNGKQWIDFFDYNRLYPGYYGTFMTGAGTSTAFRAKCGYARVVGINEMPEDVMLGTGDFLTNPNSLGGATQNHPSIVGNYTVYFGAIRPLIEAMRREYSRFRDPVIRNEGRGTTAGSGAGESVNIRVTNGATVDNGNDAQMTGTGSGSSASYSGTAFYERHVDVATGGATVTVALVNQGGTGLASCTLAVPFGGRWLIRASGTATTSGPNVRNMVVADATRVTS